MASSSLPDSVLECLKAGQQASLDDLFTLLSIPSVSAEGTGIREASTFLMDCLDELGFSVRIGKGSGNPVILAERPGPEGAPVLLFYNHYDVQPPDPRDAWKSDPFQPEIRDGKVFARGAADNKGNIMARLAAVRAWVASGEEPGCTIRFFIEGEEEISSPSLRDVTENEAEFLKSDLTIWESGYRDEAGRAQILLGCKGIATATLSCRTASADLHSSQATLVPNALWRLVDALHSMKSPDGSPAVPGLSDGLLGPDETEMALLRDTGFTPEELRRRTGAPRLLVDSGGDPFLERHWFRPTITINGWRGGYGGPGHKTVLPSKGEALVDIRLARGMSPENVRQALRKHLDRLGFQDVSIDDFHGYPAASTHPSDPSVNIVRKAAEGLWKEGVVVYPSMVMSGPMWLFRRHAPCIGIGVGHAGSNIHAPNESIHVEDFHRGAVHVGSLLRMISHG